METVNIKIKVPKGKYCRIDKAAILKTESISCDYWTIYYTYGSQSCEIFGVNLKKDDIGILKCNSCIEATEKT